MWLSFLFSVQGAASAPEPAVSVSLNQIKFDKCETYCLTNKNWCLVNVDFVDAMKSTSVHLLLSDGNVHDFSPLESTVWEVFKAKFQEMIDQCEKRSEKSPNLKRVLDKLKNIPIIFTLGEHTETLGPDAARRVLELTKQHLPNDRPVCHITLNLKELEHSHIYSIKTKRLVQYKDVQNATDSYLLVPFLQPNYMILAHELLHVLVSLDRQSQQDLFPPEQWQYYSHHNPILWSQHFSEKGDYDKTMRKLWTSMGEIEVIIGFPGADDIITENMIRNDLGLPLRALHKGPDDATSASSLYEPCQYFEKTMAPSLWENIPENLPLSDEDYYALGKLYGHIPTSKKGSRTGSNSGIFAGTATSNDSAGEAVDTVPAPADDSAAASLTTAQLAALAAENSPAVKVAEWNKEEK